MKGFGKIVVGYMVLLAGCQQVDEIENMGEEPPVSIEASIGNMQMSRYASSDNSPNNLVFEVGDDIGLFMEGKNLVKWTKTQNGWSAETPLYWPNKSDGYDFYAYYPYADAISMDRVPMPSLAGQTGTVESLSDCDFLVAFVNQNYGTDGTVSFTGQESSFSHVSSLVAITIKGNCDLKTSTIQKISFSAPDIASGTTYFLSDGTMDIDTDRISDKMESGDLDYTMEGVDQTFYFIIPVGGVTIAHI